MSESVSPAQRQDGEGSDSVMTVQGTRKFPPQPLMIQAYQGAGG